MPDLKTIQAKNLNRLINAECRSETEFAEITGFRIQSVSRWLHAKAAMTANSAKAINAKFPNYSVEYLLGVTEWNNEQIDYLKTLANGQRLDAVELLAEDGGFEVDFVAYAERFKLDELQKLGVSDDFGYIITRGEKSMVLSADSFENFANEVSAYVEMRLNLMLERGGW